MLEANALAYTVGSGEGMTKWGRSGGKGVLIDGLVGRWKSRDTWCGTWLPGHHWVCRAHLQQEVSALGRPLHGLLLDEALGQ